MQKQVSCCFALRLSNILFCLRPYSNLLFIIGLIPNQPEYFVLVGGKSVFLPTSIALLCCGINIRLEVECLYDFARPLFSLKSLGLFFTCQFSIFDISYYNFPQFQTPSKNSHLKLLLLTHQ
jgi:hypothetical protein